MARPFVLTAELRVRANRSSVRKAASEVSRAISGISGGKATSGLSGASGGGRNPAAAHAANAAAVNKTSRAYKNLYTSTRQARRESATFVRDIASLTAGVFSLHKGLVTLQQGFQGFRQLETRLGNIRQVTGGSVASTRALAQATTELAKRYGVANDALLGTSQELLQAGKGMAQVKGWLPTLALLAKNGQVGADGLGAVAKAMVTWQNAFKLSDSEVSGTLEKATALAKSQFVAVDELIQASTILNKVWADAGGTADQMLATLAAVKTATGRPGSEVARGLSTITQRITAPETKAFLRDNGVDPFDAQGQFRGIIPVIADISKLREQLSPTSEQGKELQRVLAGIRQQSIGSSLLSELPQIQKNLKTTANSFGVLERDFGAVADTFDTKLGQLGQTAQATFNSLGSGPFGELGKNLIDTTRNLLEMETALLAVGAAAAVAGARRSGLAGGLIGGGKQLGGRFASAYRMRGLRGAGQVAHRNVGMAGGYAVGAGAAFYGAANINARGTGSAALKGGLQGVGAGLTALALGANPVVAGFTAAATAAVGLAEGLEEARAAAVTAGLDDARRETQNLAGRYGVTDKKTLGALRREAQALSQAEEKSRQGPNKWATAWRSYVPGWDTSYINKTLKQDRERVMAQAQKSKPMVDAMREAFISSGKGMGSYDSFGDGILKQIEIIDDLADDGMRNFTTNFKESIENALKETAKRIDQDMMQAARSIKAGEAGNLAASLSRRASGVNMPQGLYTAFGGSAANRFAGLGNVGSAAFAQSVGALGLDKGQASLLNNINAAHSVLGKTLGSTSFTEGGFKGQITGALSGAGVSQSVIDSVSSAMSDMTFEQFEKALSDPTALLGQLTQGLQGAITGAQQFGDALNQQRQALVSQFNDLMGLRNQAQAGRASVHSAQYGLAELRSSFAGMPLKPGASAELLRRQVGSTVQAEQRRLANAQAQFSATGDERWASVIQDSTSKLQQLGNAAARTGSIMDNLNREQASRQGKLSNAERFLFASGQERAQMLQKEQAAQHVLKSGTLEGLNLQQQRAAVAGLRQRGDVIARDGEFKGKTGNQAADALLAKLFGIDKGPEGRNITQLQEAAAREHMTAAAALKSAAKALEDAARRGWNQADPDNRRIMAEQGRFAHPVDRLPPPRQPLPAHENGAPPTLGIAAADKRLTQLEDKLADFASRIEGALPDRVAVDVNGLDAISNLSDQQRQVLEPILNQILSAVNGNRVNSGDFSDYGPSAFRR